MLKKTQFHIFLFIEKDSHLSVSALTCKELGGGYTGPYNEKKTEQTRNQ